MILAELHSNKGYEIDDGTSNDSKDLKIIMHGNYLEADRRRIAEKRRERVEKEDTIKELSILEETK